MAAKKQVIAPAKPAPKPIAAAAPKPAQTAKPVQQKPATLAAGKPAAPKPAAPAKSSISSASGKATMPSAGQPIGKTLGGVKFNDAMYLKGRDGNSPTGGIIEAGIKKLAGQNLKLPTGNLGAGSEGANSPWLQNEQSMWQQNAKNSGGTWGAAGQPKTPTTQSTYAAAGKPAVKSAGSQGKGFLANPPKQTIPAKSNQPDRYAQEASRLRAQLGSSSITPEQKARIEQRMKFKGYNQQGQAMNQADLSKMSPNASQRFFGSPSGSSPVANPSQPSQPGEPPISTSPGLSPSEQTLPISTSPQGDQMYAGGSPNFNEQTGQYMPDQQAGGAGGWNPAGGQGGWNGTYADFTPDYPNPAWGKQRGGMGGFGGAGGMPKMGGNFGGAFGQPSQQPPQQQWQQMDPAQQQYQQQQWQQDLANRGIPADSSQWQQQMQQLQNQWNPNRY